MLAKIKYRFFTDRDTTITTILYILSILILLAVAINAILRAAAPALDADRGAPTTTVAGGGAQPAATGNAAKDGTKPAQTNTTASSSTKPSNGTSTSTSTSNVSSTPITAASATKHFAANTNYNQSLAISLGYNVVDVAGSTNNPSTTTSIVNALPSGVQALVWVGNLDNTNCTTPGFTTAQFQALIDALAGNDKVFGYYLSDEPHPLTCPNAVSDIRARADYLHSRSSTQKAFIVAEDGSSQCGSNLGCEYSTLKPDNTHVDLIGLDPYPCHYSGGTAVPCDNTKITSAVNTAVSAGIPKSAIVPTFQTFGQYGRTDGGSVYYRLPTTSELSSMLSTWASLVPNPVMDYSYTFGVQCSASSCVAPQALGNQPSLHPIMQSHNGA